MANVKISELPAATTLDGTEQIPVVQAAGTAKATVADILAAIDDDDIPASIARDAEVAAAVGAHEGAGDPHPGYATDADLAGGLAGKADTGHDHDDYAAGDHTHSGSYEPAGAVAAHEADTTNVHGIADTAGLALTATFTANGKGFVNHGATAGTARPTGFASVEWYGSVQPTNAVAGDTWVDTA